MWSDLKFDKLSFLNFVVKSIGNSDGKTASPQEKKAIAFAAFFISLKFNPFSLNRSDNVLFAACPQIETHFSPRPKRFNNEVAEKKAERNQ